MRLKLFFIALGCLMIAFSQVSHAQSISLQPELNSFELQQDSSYPFDLDVYLSTQVPLEVYTYIDDFEDAQFDSGLPSHQTLFPLSGELSFPSRIVVGREAAPGLYNIALEMKGYKDGFLAASDRISLSVRVAEKGQTVYLTDSYGKNTVPELENVQFSRSRVLLNRQGEAFLDISFRLAGAESDFTASALNPCTGIQAELLNPEFLRATGQDNKLFVKLSADALAPEQSCPIQFMLKDNGTGRQMHLGEVEVLIKAIYSSQAITDNSIIEAHVNYPSQAFYWLENTSSFPQEFSLSASSEMVEFSTPTISLAAGEKKQVSFIVRPKEKGSFPVRLTAESLEGNTASHTHFTVNVVEGLPPLLPFDGSTGMLSSLEASGYVLLGLAVVIGLFLLFKGKELRRSFKEKAEKIVEETKVFDLDKEKQDVKAVLRKIEAEAEEKLKQGKEVIVEQVEQISSGPIEETKQTKIFEDKDKFADI